MPARACGDSWMACAATWASAGSPGCESMKVLFVYGSLASFTRADLESLRDAHTVRELHFRRGILHLLPSIAAAIKGALWADLVLSWFGSIHAIVPFLAGRALRKPCVV